MDFGYLHATLWAARLVCWLVVWPGSISWDFSYLHATQQAARLVCVVLVVEMVELSCFLCVSTSIRGSAHLSVSWLVMHLFDNLYGACVGLLGFVMNLLLFLSAVFITVFMSSMSFFSK